MRNGFQKILVPRYWIPLTTKGTAAIKLGLHRDIRTYIPERLLDVLLNLRKAFYSRRARAPEERTTLDSHRVIERSPDGTDFEASKLVGDTFSKFAEETVHVSDESRV
jgi:hypothetical protein